MLLSFDYLVALSYFRLLLIFTFDFTKDYFFIQENGYRKTIPYWLSKCDVLNISNTHYQYMQHNSSQNDIYQQECKGKKQQLDQEEAKYDKQVTCAGISRSASNKAMYYLAELVIRELLR